MAIEGIKLRDKKIFILTNGNWNDTSSKDQETDSLQLKKYIQAIKPKLISLCTGMPDTLQGLRRNKLEAEEISISQSEVAISEVQTEAGTVLRVKTVLPQPTNFLELYDEQEAFIAKPDPPKKLKVVKANSDLFEQKLKSLSINEPSKPNYYLKIYSENKRNISKTDTIIFSNKKRKINLAPKTKNSDLELLTHQKNISKKEFSCDKMKELIVENISEKEMIVKYGKKMKNVKIKLSKPARKVIRKREDDSEIFSKFTMTDDFDPSDTLFFTN